VPHKIAVEIAVQDTQGVRIAGDVGADRVELAQALALGGLTPSPATIELALEQAAVCGVEVHVLIRPRAGGFQYSAEEVAAAERDVRWAVRAGAHGVVVGALDDDGTLDLEAMARLTDAAGTASVTLHRAIDLTPDPRATLRAARDLGVRRILTSGGASAAIDGADTLRALVAEAAGGIEVMAGGGVSAASARQIAALGVDAIHFSAKRTVGETGGLLLGSADGSGGGHETTDLETARAIVAALG